MASPSYANPGFKWHTSFSLRRCYIAGGAGLLSASNAASVTTWTRLPGVLDMTLTPNAKSLDQFGDDGLVGIWVYDSRATMELTTSMIVMDIYSLLTGNTVAVHASGGQNVQTIYFGSDLEHAPPHFFCRGYSTSRDETSAISACEYTRVTLFNCQMSNVVVPEGVGYGKVAEQRYRIEVLPGYVDEYGNSLQGVAGPGSIFALGKIEQGLAAYPQDHFGTPDNTFGTIFG